MEDVSVTEMPESEGVYFLETPEVKVRKHYHEHSLFIYAQDQGTAFRTLSQFIDEYGLGVKVCYIEWNPQREYRLRLVVHT